MAKYDGKLMETFGGEVPDNVAERVDYRVHRLIVRANNNMSLEQSKVFHVVLSEVHQQRKGIIEISKEKFFDLTGLTSKDRWDRYKPIFKGLVDKTRLEFFDAENDLYYNGGVCTEVIWPRKEQKPIRISIGSLLLPYLLEILDKSTLLYLDEIMTFKSDFTLRLYLYFKSWNAVQYDDGHLDQNMRYLTTEQLFKLFNLPEDAYHDKNGKFMRLHFERRTLEPACKEISEKTGIRCQVTKKNYGKRRRVLNYVFEWVDFKNSRRGGRMPEDPFQSERGSSGDTQLSIDDFD